METALVLKTLAAILRALAYLIRLQLHDLGHFLPEETKAEAQRHALYMSDDLARFLEARSRGLVE